MQRHVALLRGINVGGQRKMPMQDLRAMAEESGFTGVRTYVASGNLVLESSLAGAEIEAALERGIRERFGFDVDVIVRPQHQWAAYAKENPFSAQAGASPNLVMICIGKEEATEADLLALSARAGYNEQVALGKGVLWIYYGDGAGRSRIAPGSTKGIWTTRNWSTVQRLAEMMRA